MMKKKIFFYDTTLRDGAQSEGISFHIEDKISVAKNLDQLRMDYIEGGWPGSNPKDALFFERMKKESLKHSQLTAFGCTRRKNIEPHEDKNLNLLIESEAPIITIFGKSWDFHVTEVLKTTLSENKNIIHSSVHYLKSHGRKVFYDAEHFFDGYQANPDYAIQTLESALEGGAEVIILCDTNGGCLPDQVYEITHKVKEKLGCSIGIHCHNDGELAVANTLSAVEAGASQIQGTINGYGERCGNANLCSLIPNLLLKKKYTAQSENFINSLTSVSRNIAQLANTSEPLNAPFVGKSAFAHKGGMHVNAVQKNPLTFEHIEPSVIGNNRRILVSDLSGRSNIEMKLESMNFKVSSLTSEQLAQILTQIKELENQGYIFEGAEASFILLVSKIVSPEVPPFSLDKYRMFIGKENETSHLSEARLKLKIGNQTTYVVSEGKGPVHALDNAMKQALRPHFSFIDKMELINYKVRVLDGDSSTASQVRVLISFRLNQLSWGTVGVSEDIVEASYMALRDAYFYAIKYSKE